MVQEAVGGTGEEDLTDSRHYGLMVIGGGPARQTRGVCPTIEQSPHWAAGSHHWWSAPYTLREAALYRIGFRDQSHKGW
jgi:hypothetical protein